MRAHDGYPENVCPCGRHCLNHGPQWDTKLDSTSTTTRPTGNWLLFFFVLLVGAISLLPLKIEVEKAENVIEHRQFGWHSSGMSAAIDESERRGSVGEEQERLEMLQGKLVLHGLGWLFLAVVLGYGDRLLRDFILFRWHCGRPMKELEVVTRHRATDTCKRCGRVQRRKWKKEGIRLLCACCGYTA